MSKVGESKYPGAARVGINPTPIAVECCKHLNISGLPDLLAIASLRHGERTMGTAHCKRKGFYSFFFRRE